ncbi:hypothetical protein JWG39_06830 [Desulforhopalus vacuolatus]|uniref:hypothetical protein n=1 Tax=Desulforhopalus vacuolatus TaxID=40414 RepID=UPI0019652662|nr:hypothetical protein [Desulforhopalus vacuolatus]MBM9519533.1 hypothetical protein [Desulforhopalus vacuolatus]
MDATQNGPRRPRGIEIKGDIEPQLDEKYHQYSKFFKKRGWHLIYTGSFLGLTVSDDVSMGAQENIRIVDISSFIEYNGSPEGGGKFWETKTYWGGRRVYSENFDEVWDHFLKEQGNYDPRRLAWSYLDDEYRATQRMRDENRALEIIANILGKDVSEFRINSVAQHLDVFGIDSTKLKRFCSIFVNLQKWKNIKLYTGKKKEETIKITDIEALENHWMPIINSFIKYSDTFPPVRKSQILERPPMLFQFPRASIHSR